MSDAGGRVLAIDLGDVRVGLAISDPLGVTAQPHGQMQRRPENDAFGRIQDLVERWEVMRVLVGLPLLLSGEAGARAIEARAFADHLAEVLPGVPVELWDERLTTVQAERAMISGNVKRRRRREVIDSLAAVLILQSWLDSRSTHQVPD